MQRGWILDLYEDENDGVRLWVITEDGDRRMLRQRMPMTFFAAGDTSLLHGCCLFLRTYPGVLKLARELRQDVFLPEPVCVLRVDMEGPVQLQRCFTELKQLYPELTWYDADTPIRVRHAARFGTFPMAFCEWETDPLGGEVTAMQVLNSRWDLRPVLPILRTAELKPDCDPHKCVPRAMDYVFDGFKQRIPLDDASEAILRLNELLVRDDPDFLLTEWGDDCLIPKLLELQKLCGEEVLLNRDGSRQVLMRKEKSFFSYGQVIYRAPEACLFGRCHIDTRNAMMWRDYRLDGTLETARVTALSIAQSARVSPGSGISSMQMITALQKGVLIPEQKQQAESEKTALELIRSDRGGMIYQPLTGLYGNVAEIDFVSMYPSIIINGNISPEIPLPDGLKPAQAELGIVPLTIKPLYEKRVKLKERLLQFPDKDVPLAKSCKTRAAALKWLLVVCFGFLGYKNARFGRIESHEAVTRGGREALLMAKEAAEDMGFEVLHMFVDALWIRKKGCIEVADFQPVLDEISARTHMLIALDGIYNWVAFLPSVSNSAQPVPNRYFGAFRDGSLKMRGIEARRGDMPPWIIETQEAALRCLAKASDLRVLPDYVRRAFALFQSELQKLNNDEVPTESLVLTVRVSRETDAYKMPPPSVRAAIQLEKRTGVRFAPGQKVRFIYTRTPDKVSAWELPDVPPPDKSRYRELLGKAAGTVFTPFGIPPQQMEAWAAGTLQFSLPV